MIKLSGTDIATCLGPPTLSTECYVVSEPPSGDPVAIVVCMRKDVIE